MGYFDRKGQWVSVATIMSMAIVILLCTKTVASFKESSFEATSEGRQQILLPKSVTSHDVAIQRFVGVKETSKDPQGLRSSVWGSRSEDGYEEEPLDRDGSTKSVDMSDVDTESSDQEAAEAQIKALKEELAKTKVAQTDSAENSKDNEAKGSEGTGEDKKEDEGEEENDEADRENAESAKENDKEGETDTPENDEADKESESNNSENDEANKESESDDSENVEAEEGEGDSEETEETEDEEEDLSTVKSEVSEDSEITKDSHTSASTLGNRDLRPEQFDDQCSWDYANAHCDPPEYCEYRYSFGDMDLGKSCRAMEDIDIVAATEYFDRQTEAEESEDEEPILGLTDDVCHYQASTATCMPENICHMSLKHFGCVLKSEEDLRAEIASLSETFSAMGEALESMDVGGEVDFATGVEGAEEKQLNIEESSFQQEKAMATVQSAKKALDTFEKDGGPENLEQLMVEKDTAKESFDMASTSKETVLEDQESSEENDKTINVATADLSPKEREAFDARTKAAEEQYDECATDCATSAQETEEAGYTCCNGVWWRYTCFCYLGTCCD